MVVVGSLGQGLCMVGLGGWAGVGGRAFFRGRVSPLCVCMCVSSVCVVWVWV